MKTSASAGETACLTLTCGVAKPRCATTGPNDCGAHCLLARSWVPPLFLVKREYREDTTNTSCEQKGRFRSTSQCCTGRDRRDSCSSHAKYARHAKSQ